MNGVQGVGSSNLPVPTNLAFRINKLRSSRDVPKRTVLHGVTMGSKSLAMALNWP